MKTFLLKFTMVWMILAALLFGINSFVLADDGIYLGVSFVNNNPGGGFNGDTYYTDSVYRIGKPALQSGNGFAVAVGGDFDFMGIDIIYANSSHPGSCHIGSYYNWDGTAALNELDINAKLFFNNESSFRPYGLAGLSILWVNLPGAEHNTSDVSTGDATYLGFGFNLGGGIDYKILDRLNLKGEVIYRFGGYDSATGSSMGSGNLPETIDGGGVCISIGARYKIVEY